ncbi:MAG: c-type cytochrome [Chitinophagaceae bacterium]|nr:c-type cytochrome [Chitinophagaceae bacterium]
MFKNKTILTLLACAAFVVFGVAAAKAPRLTPRNLKVLPQDISDARLDSIMQSYNKALGVSCSFCHVKTKSFTDSLDFVSDAEPMKENAREMMRMTIEINKNHFYFDKKERPEYLTTITCKTCHRGEPFPPED